MRWHGTDADGSGTMKTEICILDLPTGRVDTVFRTDRLIEAPNWGPDDTLIVNGDGRLYRLPLNDPGLLPIDTGILDRLNNDHGPSPDGKLLAFSDKTETGMACIYVMPADGGPPLRVTPKIPSYFHGWSPDGARLAYTAKRGGVFEVCTCALDGSDERQLSHSFDHCDGPDYSHDGAWIWFNGEADGAVDLWRVPAAGGSAERMTRDDAVNWFPHPSPDGAHVLYLAFPPGTSGHPRDCEVALRLMPADGGTPETITRLFGGQGSVNVPCWAPDGARFAFARYARPDGSF